MKALTEGDWEKAVVGGCMAQPRRIPDVVGLIRVADFTVPQCGLIFDALVAMDGEGRPIDSLTLAGELRRRGVLEKVGMAFLAELDTAAPMASNVVEYAKAVADLALRRQLLRVFQDAAAKALAGVGTTEELVAGTETQMLALLGGERATPRLRKFDAIIEASIEVVDLNQNTLGGVTGLPTGLVDLDRQLTGLHGGELIIVAARPGGGKSVFGLQAAAHAALNEKAGVLIFSIEMPGDQLGLRSLASEGLVSLSRLRGAAPLTDADLTRFNEAAAKLHQAPIWVDDSPTLNLARLRSTARRLRLTTHLGLIVIDYLQLMEGAKGDGREQEVANITRGLKALAKELGVPVVALAQLNRKVDDGSGPPKLSHLRESGAIEQDADVVIFIHAEASEEDGPVGLDVLTDLVVAKQRNGPTGPVPVVFRKEYLRLVDRARGETPSPPRREFTQAPEAD